MPSEICTGTSCGCEHTAYFYTNSDSLLERLTHYVAEGLDAGKAAVIIATQSHIAGLLARLAAHLDVDAHLSRGQLACLDADRALGEIMNGQQPSEARFNRIIERLVQDTSRRFAGMVAYGELVNLLWQQGNFSAANQLEQWWNRLIERYGFSLLCGYRANIFSYEDGVVDHVDQVCATHARVDAGEDDARLDAAVNSALQQVLPGSDLTGLRQALSNRARPGVTMPSAHAVLLGLHSLLPSLAQDVRMIARDHYYR